MTASLELTPALRERAEALARKSLNQTANRDASISPDEAKELLFELRVHQIELEMQNEELRQAQHSLTAERERYFDLYELAPVSYLTLSAKGLIVQANLKACTLLGVSRSALLKQAFIHFLQQEDRGIFHSCVKQLDAGNDVQACELRLLGKAGTTLWVHLTASTATDSTQAKTLRIVLTDLTKAKAAEEQVKSLAFTDTLTGLPNRRQLVVRLQNAISGAQRQKEKSALLFLNLDQFKSLNDAIGHEQADLVLQQVAKRLKTCSREHDTVARIGGDEFVLLIEHLSADPLESVQQAETVARKVQEALRQPYQIGERQLHCSASMGLSFLDPTYEGTEEPLKRAELAMYQAKSGGRDTLRFFDPHMQELVSAKAILEADLRRAIDERQFLLHYQAQVSDQHGIIGVEVLLRWRHPERGLVSPAEFIPLAEETGLILQIGAWVLESACQQLAQWAGQPELEHLSLAVNVSARQFRESSFVEQVLSTLERTLANAQRLKLELTESVLVADVADVIAKMNALKARGIGFAIDDFGTGYSSLAYLKRLPLERLKIDQGFVRDILMDPDDVAIARAVIALADSLGLGEIAEGVETQAQRELLASLGCHTYQGYLFSRPLPVDEFEALVRRG